MRLIGVTAAVVMTACGATAGAGEGAPTPARPSPDAAARADSVRNAYTAADVKFMADMIHHHAQALVMARMAPTHGASSDLQLLAERIINSQKGEIALMRDWLRDHGEPVPEPESVGTGMTAPSHITGDGDHAENRHGHAMLMPGMLTSEQLDELDAARDFEFDRLFLTYMIQHHQGALTMVDELLNSVGGAQNQIVFRLVSGIGADQTAEIDRMRSMLRDMLFETSDPP